MIALHLPTPRLNHALAAGAAVFAALAVWPWLIPPVPAIRPLTAPPASAPMPALAALPPLATYAAIVERPLFSPSRRPAAGAATVGPSVESRYRLLGIVATGPKKKAFIADGVRRLEIAEGETLDGWTVKEIGANRVRLVSPAGEAAVKFAPAPAEPQKPQ